MLLIDNNSTDGWRAAVAPYGRRVRVKTDARRHAQLDQVPRRRRKLARALTVTPRGRPRGGRPSRARGLGVDAEGPRARGRPLPDRARGHENLNAEEDRRIAQVQLWHATLKREFADDWVLVVDVDEYMFARNPAVPLSAAVRDVLNPGAAHAVAVPWTGFGSSGRARQPKNGTVCGFTMRRAAR